MESNVGTVDRALRAVVGVLLLGLVFGYGIGPAWFSWVVAVIGVVLLVTALLGTCPAYRLLGIRTSRK